MSAIAFPLPVVGITLLAVLGAGMLVETQLGGHELGAIPGGKRIEVVLHDRRLPDGVGVAVRVNSGVQVRFGLDLHVGLDAMSVLAVELKRLYHLFDRHPRPFDLLERGHLIGLAAHKGCEDEVVLLELPPEGFHVQDPHTLFELLEGDHPVVVDIEDPEELPWQRPVYRHIGGQFRHFRPAAR